ncbi:MAG TPA: hypothetical protein VFN58_05760 [Candidatus Binatia bacterium]|jgi:hypothetical protein|nr:hypothetical protein [Candidatus Binatia bacterium]
MILDLTTIPIGKAIGLMRHLAGVACIVLLASLAQAQTSKETPPKLSAELERVRSALIKYQDPIKAVHDGYFSTVGCVRYPTGGMGIHFLNPQLIGPVPDPMRPTILLYEPVGDKLRLVGAEWFIPLATGVKERPQLFGQPFDGPMEGHEPLMPATLRHYDLHVWLFKSNPAGLFNMVNPNVNCPKTAYTFLEHPPKTLPQQ